MSRSADAIQRCGSFPCYEIWRLQEKFHTVQDVANRAKEVLIQTTEDKAAYEKQYARFRKLLSASRKDIPLSEIVDCIDKVVVDGGGKIVVKWDKGLK